MYSLPPSEFTYNGRPGSGEGSGLCQQVIIVIGASGTVPAYGVEPAIKRTAFKSRLESHEGALRNEHPGVAPTASRSRVHSAARMSQLREERKSVQRNRPQPIDLTRPPMSRRMRAREQEGRRHRIYLEADSFDVPSCDLTVPGFEVFDVENLRPHYALTCAAWVDRLIGRRDECLRHVDAETYRLAKRYAQVARRLTRAYMYP
jgi:hypothetical protein